jgi:hypothetical protein
VSALCTIHCKSLLKKNHSDLARLPEIQIFDLLPGKKEPHKGIPAGFWHPDGINYVAKKSSTKRPLEAGMGGRFRPYFTKQNVNKA